MTTAPAVPRDVTAERLARARTIIAGHAASTRGREPAAIRPSHGAARRGELPPIERILGGAWIETALGGVFARDTWFALDHPHGNLPLNAGLDLPPEALDCLLGVAPTEARSSNPQTAPITAAPGARALHPPCAMLQPPPIQTEPARAAFQPPASSVQPLLGNGAPRLPTAVQPPPTETAPGRRMAFFDIETTGLGGGTGTYAFLAGLGSFEDDGFRLRQYFLADVGGEKAMLALLAEDTARCDALVTYNGRAFDVPIVETRLTLSRLASPYREMAHFDLLHAVRRIYRHRMPSCRLADAERRLLGIERFDDTPGSLMPALYFAYVRAGQTAPLRGVFQHNAEDVLSLVGVLARLAALFCDDNPPADDATALARWWELAGSPERARELYRAALPWLEGGDDWAWAAQRLARLERRSGAHDQAASLWRTLWARGDGASGLALAKHLEHRARDYAGAERLTLALLEGAAGAEREALELRLARLRRKAGGRTAVSAAS